MIRAHEKIAKLFPIAKCYEIFIPTYASGQWCLGFASKKLDPEFTCDEAYWNNLLSTTGFKPKYYNPQIHKGSFALPCFVKDLLGIK
jgi:spermidine synthase